MPTLSASLHDDVAGLFGGRPDVIADRYALYRRLRDESPFFDFGDQVILSRYADIQQTILRDQDFHMGGANLLSSELKRRYDSLPVEQRPKLVEFFDFRGRWITAVNGDDHIRLRSLAHRAFTPRVLDRVRTRIDQIADDLADNAVRQGQEVDLINQFAWILPLMVISEMLDVPTDRLEDVRRWSVDVASFSGAGGSNYGGALEVAYPSLFALKAYLGEVFAQRRGASTTDLMGSLLAAETDEGERFTVDELVGMIAQLIWAGHETTTNLIGNGLYALLSHRDQWDLLCSDPEGLAPDAVEEALRYLSPTQITKRMAVRDTEINGIEIPKYQTVTFMLAAANRDAAQFPDPDRFDIRRDDGKHLAFGLGPRFCLGSALARLEGAAALRTLASRFPAMRLASADVTWNANSTFCSLESLPVFLS